MALSDLVVFQEYLQTSSTEVLAQQIENVNSASAGVFQLSDASHMGDYNEKTFFTKISGLVRRRNPYASGAVAGKRLAQVIDAMVKVAAGTPPVDLSPGQFKWIQMNPQEAGAAMGQQLAKDMLADMINTGIMAGQAALAGQAAAVQYDGTADTPDTMTHIMLNKASAKFGDRSQDIAAWIMHSTSMHDLFGNNITNSEKLFVYGTVNILRDAFGRVFVVTDSPALYVAGAPAVYYALGLVPNAIIVDRNNDYTENISTVNGDENIIRTFQAEWSYNLGIKGYTWDITNGGKAPTDATLAIATNWDKIVTSIKDTAGVMLVTN